MRNYLLTLLFLAGSIALLPGQTCTGSLGNNIFTAGDFGSGVANILTPDPRIAPDYQYATSGPPADGWYMITNNTGAWPQLYPSWLAVRDNSPDPNGYMMVVNASFQPGLFYNQEVTGLCPNTLYEFSADVLNLIRRNTTGHIAPNVSFLIDGVERFTTGLISQTERWETYGFTFTTGPNQTSVRLSLRNNAPGGIGNDLALDNITFRPCGDEAFILPLEVANICEDGEPIPLVATINGSLFGTPAYQWQRSPDGLSNWTDIPGATSTTYLHTEVVAGSYFYRFALANSPGNLTNEKCRLYSNTKEVRVIPKYYNQTDTLCAGLTYTLGGSVFTASGLYEIPLINRIGCDSIIRLNLVVVPDRGIQATFQVESTTCSTPTTGQIRILNTRNGTPPYAYALGTNPAGSTALFSPLAGGASYRFTISDHYGCRLDTSIFLQLPDPPQLDLGPDLSITLGEEISISATTNFPVVQYQWSSTVDNLPACPPATCDELRWPPTKNQTVRLTAQDANGCTVSDSVSIKVRSLRQVYIPDAFSPNGDGINDYFTLFAEQPRVQTILSLRIYDRWGGLVFSRQNLLPGDPLQGWDGRFRNQPVDEGVYLYQLQVEFIDGQVREYNGEVALVR